MGKSMVSCRFSLKPIHRHGLFTPLKNMVLSGEDLPKKNREPSQMCSVSGCRWLQSAVKNRTPRVSPF